MEMFLMILCMSFFSLAIMAAAFGASTRSEQPAAPRAAKPDVPAPQPVARFFSDYTVPQTPGHTQVPIEALLLQIENHIRLEHAAAETFLSAPSPALLHHKTISKFVN